MSKQIYEDKPVILIGKLNDYFEEENEEAQVGNWEPIQNDCNNQKQLLQVENNELLKEEEILQELIEPYRKYQSIIEDDIHLKKDDQLTQISLDEESSVSDLKDNQDESQKDVIQNSQDDNQNPITEQNDQSNKEMISVNVKVLQNDSLQHNEKEGHSIYSPVKMRESFMQRKIRRLQEEEGLKNKNQIDYNRCSLDNLDIRPKLSQVQKEQDMLKNRLNALQQQDTNIVNETKNREKIQIHQSKVFNYQREAILQKSYEEWGGQDLGETFKNNGGKKNKNEIYQIYQKNMKKREEKLNKKIENQNQQIEHVQIKKDDKENNMIEKQQSIKIDENKDYQLNKKRKNAENEHLKIWEQNGWTQSISDLKSRKSKLEIEREALKIKKEQNRCLIQKQ